MGTFAYPETLEADGGRWGLSRRCIEEFGGGIRDCFRASFGALLAAGKAVVFGGLRMDLLECRWDAC